MAIQDIKNRDEAVTQVLEGFQWLIMHHARATASEQYAPSHTPDESDDYIKEHKEWVEHLRTMREKFESLVTGILE